MMGDDRHCGGGSSSGEESCDGAREVGRADVCAGRGSVVVSGASGLAAHAFADGEDGGGGGRGNRGVAGGGCRGCGSADGGCRSCGCAAIGCGMTKVPSSTESISIEPSGAEHRMKYLVVTGGTVSGLGKGTTISAIGVLLQALGFRVTAMKIDPYLNIDAGTMSPYEHGEVYVLEDGGEVDLDLGNYERLLGCTLSRDHNITTGKIYESVISRERKGDYLGKTVQIVPHVTNAIQQWISTVAYRSVEGGGATGVFGEEKAALAGGGFSAIGVDAPSAAGGALIPRAGSPRPGTPGGSLPDICLIEVGGVVGDIESMAYLEALQQFAFKAGPDAFCLCHLSSVPWVCGEPKTKPTQHSVKELRHAGLRPDFVFCRSPSEITPGARAKIALFSQVPPTHVIDVPDVTNAYHLPLVLDRQKFGEMVCDIFKLIPKPPEFVSDALSLPAWRRLARKKDAAATTVKIAIVGKYTSLSDAYLSVTKALDHAAVMRDLRLEILWIESTDLEGGEAEAEAEAAGTDAAAAGSPPSATAAAAASGSGAATGSPPSAAAGAAGSPSAAAGGGGGAGRSRAGRAARAWRRLAAAEGILCPGGFGDRGIEGKQAAIRYAREKQVPFLGICLGMQLAVIEFCRSVLGLKNAHSEEFDAAADPKAVVFMPEINPNVMGGTMRLGSRATIIAGGTKAAAAAGAAPGAAAGAEVNSLPATTTAASTAGGTPPTPTAEPPPAPSSLAARLYSDRPVVFERHRHRYEVNRDLVPQLEAQGLRFVGQDESGQRMEIVELAQDVHPFFLGVQFHPEFTSRPWLPNPCFLGLIDAAKNRRQQPPHVR